MSASELLERLRATGVTVAAIGDRLRVGGPAAALTDDLLAELRACKPELLAVLAARTCSGEDPAPADTAAKAGPPYWPIAVRWGRQRGDIAVRDPVTGEWHEFAYRDAPEAWKHALRLSLSRRSGR